MSFAKIICDGAANPKELGYSGLGEHQDAPVRAATWTRGSRGKTLGGAIFPVSPPRAGVPRGYAETLNEIERPIRQVRIRVGLTRLRLGGTKDDRVATAAAAVNATRS